MDEKKILLEKLQDKLELEYSNFINELKYESKEYIIEQAYEITAKQEIKDYLVGREASEEELKVLLKKSYVLDNMYDKWLDTDGNLYEALQYAVDDRVGELTRESTAKELKEKAR